MGKKYIIELEETPFIQHFKNGACETIYRVKGFNSLVFDWNGLQMLTPYTEPDLEQVRKEAYEEGWKEAEDHYEKGYSDGYDTGLSDAWDAARTLWNTPNRKEIFGHTTFNTVLTTLTAQETIEKIRQYEKEKEEIKVGDEVSLKSGAKGFVTRMVMFGDEQISAYVVWSDGYVGSYNLDGLQKTGKHYSEIAEVLAKMKEGE